MESETFKSRVMALIQKSRRALRLYSSASGSSSSSNLPNGYGATNSFKSSQTASGYESSPQSRGGETSGVSSEIIGDLSAAQVREWREVNGVLLRKLSDAVDCPNAKRLVYDVFALRNEFQSMWRSSEAEMVTSQRELIACAERGDFIRAASVSLRLVTLKARVQAGQAAHHEIDLLIKKSRVVGPSAVSLEDEALASTIELLDEQAIDSQGSFDRDQPLSSPLFHVSGMVDGPQRRQAGGRISSAMGGKVIPLKRR